jgi:hypothetical protein
MTIAEFIGQHLRRRLNKTKSLAVYDPERRYQEIITFLASADCRIIDGSSFTILGREQALEVWWHLGQKQENHSWLEIVRN